MDIRRNHFQIKKPGSQYAGNAGNVFTLPLMNMFCTECGIFRFNQFPVVLIQIIQCIAEWPWDENALRLYPSALHPD